MLKSAQRPFSVPVQSSRHHREKRPMTGLWRQYLLMHDPEMHPRGPESVMNSKFHHTGSNPPAPATHCQIPETSARGEKAPVFPWVCRSTVTPEIGDC